MCDTLVYATHDVTPEFWADFALTASRRPGTPVKEATLHYALVHSPTQEHFERTPQIETTVSTELGTVSWDEIKGLHSRICKLCQRRIHPVIFLILDQQSTEDRTVVVMHKMKYRNSGVKKDAEGNEVKDGVTVWQKYRVPFEDADLVEYALSGFVPPEEADKHFVEEVERGVASESESEEESESDSTDEEDIDRKWEYIS